MTCTVTTQRRRHDDAPETDAAFSHLSGLPDGRERQALRDEIVEAWMPMAERIAGKYLEILESMRKRVGMDPN